MFRPRSHKTPQRKDCIEANYALKQGTNLKVWLISVAFTLYANYCALAFVQYEKTYRTEKGAGSPNLKSSLQSHVEDKITK